jgi:uncharacterized protein YjdB
MMIARILKNARTLAAAALPVLLVAVAFQGCKLATYENLASVTVSPANPSIAGTTSQQFTAKATYSDETPEKDVTPDAAWTSSDPSVATVSSSGLATPAQPGTTTITASLQGRSASTTLTVTNAQLQSIDVTTASPSIANGTRAQFTATGHFDDSTAQDLTSQVTWTSSDSSVTISNTGLATSTALGAATSTITATLGTIPGFTTLTVKDVTLTSMSVTPATATIKVGLAQQFTVTGTFSDLSTQNMTGEATWTSSAESVATIGSSTGRATGVFAGSTTITATSSALLGSVPGTAQLTVQTAGGGY